MLKTHAKLILICLAVFIGGVAIYVVYSINQSVQKTLAEERARLIGKNKIPFIKKVLTPLTTTQIKVFQSARQTRDMVEFDGSYFTATSGGLVRMSHEGKLEKHFTILDGLPDSDLTCLAVVDNRLFIGTRTAGLLTFDGSKFEIFEWTGRETKAITTMLSDSGRLLIGTFGGGLIEFDGRDFTFIEFGSKHANVNSIFRDASKLFIGTFDEGVYVLENGVESHLTTAGGLPSNRVIDIVRNGVDVYIATDLGFGILQPSSFQTLATLPALSGIALHDDRLFLTRDNGEIFTFEKALKRFSGETPVGGDARFSRTGDKLWLLSNRGISEVAAGRLKEFGEKDDNGLSDNFVSALAFDGAENLWAGTFRNGIDVFKSDGRKRRHIESEQVREINFLKADGESVSAGTSAGIINFGSDLSPQPAIAKNGGLPSNSIMHLSPDAIATASGLAFRDGSGYRVLTTVNGLPNNSTYTTLRSGERLYAGTLGGLAEIDGRRVVRTFTDTNSNLTTNWVTALCLGGERLLIGTYGGGVFELMPSGQIHSFAAETGKFVANFNAMHTDGERLFIGTLDGVRVLDLRSQEWSRMTRELPSQTVMAINGDDEAVYFGTASGIARIEKAYFKTREQQ